MKFAATHVAACLSIALFAGTALAKGPCANDVETLCKGVQPGGGRILACLKSHEAEVSPVCKAHLGQMKQKARQAAKACHDDVLQFCSDVRQGGGRIVNCLKEHASQLSPECKEKLADTKMQMQH